ncbi:MAG: hydrogenase iron-sulfur subunit [Gemmatimonadales bacterium]|nr:hydrogenase iron-sulfur subunit [Gemmatimonadales bacterium]
MAQDPAATLKRLLWRTLARADAVCNRLYGWRYNPLYHSGALVVALFLVLLVTGIYLLFFYRLGAPYDSVAHLTAQPSLGRWIRGLHRYASDAAVIAVALHALRLFAQGRSWGPRALAWVTGVLLFGAVLVCGWTGFVMVWDVQAQVLAQEGARLLDVVPIFSEPISRAFVGERPMPGAFFFLNLFAHIALPIGLGLIVWLHVSRVARPKLLPPRGLLWGSSIALLALSIVWPVTMGPPADLFRLPGPAPYDVFYAFWLPLTRALPVGAAWAAIVAVTLLLLLVPLWTRPRAAHRPLPSVVDEQLCSGCEQCFLDCPYDAITMTPRPAATAAAGRSALVARVDPALCVSCGICAGSCAPMGVGPPGRTGRDQLGAARAFAAARTLASSDVVVIACDRGAAALAHAGASSGVHVWPVSCAGNLHTSVIELFLRAGTGGVLVASCPPRDCWNREGPQWLEQRVYHDREAELQERVDRRRVRIVAAAAAEAEVLLTAIARFRQDIAALAAVPGERDVTDLIRLCEAEEAMR